jgi:AraC-like DNA-binding protein
VIIEDRSDHAPRALRVLGALLGASPEASLLRQAVRPPAELRHVEDRLRIVATVREHAPDVIVFAAQDSAGLPTAPLIDQCTRERSDTRIILLCASPPPRGQSILAAARAGARVLVAPMAENIAAVLWRMAQSSGLELALDCSALSTVEPIMLRQLLCAAAKTVASDGRVETLAQQLGVSTRTLSRHSQRASVVPPRSLLSATRLLWACALMELARRDLRALARITGFSGPHALLTAQKRYLYPFGVPSRGTSLPGYREALKCIVTALGGHLAS